MSAGGVVSSPSRCRCGAAAVRLGGVLPVCAECGIARGRLSVPDEWREAHDVLARAAEVAQGIGEPAALSERLAALLRERHYLGAPVVAGGGLDRSSVMVSADWYRRLCALAESK